MADADTQDTAADTTDHTAADAVAADESTKNEPPIEDRLAAATKVNKDLERKLTESRKAADRVPALEEQIAKLQGREAEYEQAKKDAETKAAAVKAANERIVRAEVRVAAAGLLNDPSDALAHIDLATFDVSEDGEVDTAAIKAAVTDLIARKPYLAAQGGARFQGNADGGARKEEPKSLDDQIAEAEKAGDFKTAMALKAQSLVDARS